MANVLIVDDDPQVRAGLANAVRSRGHAAFLAAGSTTARAVLDCEEIDCVVLDIAPEESGGLDLLQAIHAGLGQRPPVIVATASGDGDEAIGAMREGAFEYLTKPLDIEGLLDAVARAIRKRAIFVRENGSSNEATPKAERASAMFIGASAAMLSVCKMIGRAASSNAPVLVLGETGTGKELVARALHQHSSRSSAPWIAVNLASLPPTLIESEIFGHERGAFTGAHRRKEGRLELAAGGTLFLDEIGDLPLPLQTKLLRVLAEGTYERVGGTETLTCRARIVAATNVEVRPTSGGGSLREDVYYRLAAIEIELPPLRARKTDIPLLVAHAMARTKARAVTEDVMARLVAHTWPGNVRELIHVIERAALVCGADVIDMSDLPPLLREPARGERASAGDRYEDMPLREALAALEKRLLERALEKSSGNRAAAARILGIPRPQLYAKLAAHGVGRGDDT